MSSPSHNIQARHHLLIRGILKLSISIILCFPSASVIPGYPTARSSKPSRGGVNGFGSPRSHGTKDREALAEEVLELKKKIVRLTEDGNVAKAKTRRLEEENKHKEKQLESLLDPSKSDEMRRTLGSYMLRDRLNCSVVLC